MARKIASRIKITGKLVAKTPIHVGGIGGNPQIDLPLAVNGQGQYYIPGTSLAGAFSSWLEQERQANSIWGYQQEKNADGHASFIIVEDAPIEGINAEIRDGVGIDREWGTAAEQVKYDRAVLPQGCKIPLNMTLELPIESERATDYKNSFAALIKSLQKGEIRLGAAKTRGLGKVKLENVSIRESKLDNRDSILKFLKGNEEIITDNFLESYDSNCQKSKLTFEIQWQPQSPLMVKAEGNGIAVDILPLVSAIDSSLTFILPGSSIKGALRFQAERIIRTVCNSPITEPANFMEQIEVPLVEDLFGTRAKNNQKNKKGIGSLFIDDCYANIPINSSAWRNVEAATNETTLREALNNANLQNIQQAFHVAVDRWTGGAAEGMLYSNLELMKVNWKPIYLTLDINHLHENKLSAISLFLLCLRDLVDGRIPLGYGTNRGMGTIKVNSIVINSDNLPDDLNKFTNVTLLNGNLTDLDSELLTNLNNAWKTWIDTQNKAGN
ncbi:MAG TPA: RAMP superfamily CRISPR-associated protein [Nostocaceae cyanobacterium]|nr:RAMP superfamily CRISPR-associated protein [Nostocaceae cyanobacterium]